jgi:DNA-binding CsgD family transcriptional regulator
VPNWRKVARPWFIKSMSLKKGTGIPDDPVVISRNRVQWRIWRIIGGCCPKRPGKRKHMLTSAPTSRKYGAPFRKSEGQCCDLIRSLVSQLSLAPGEQTQPAGNGHDSEEILLDVDVDGARYLLIRTALQPARAQLSPREQEIVRMVARGHSSKMIADVLGISSWTVCTHLRRIFAKLGVGSRAAMVARSIESRTQTKFKGAEDLAKRS